MNVRLSAAFLELLGVYRESAGADAALVKRCEAALLAAGVDAAEVRQVPMFGRLALVPPTPTAGYETVATTPGRREKPWKQGVSRTKGQASLTGAWFTALVVAFLACCFLLRF